MSQTGITVCDEFPSRFKALKTDHTIGYMVLTIENEKKIIIEEEGDPFEKNGPIEANKQAHLALKEKITAKNEPKYIFIDVHAEKPGGGRREKIVFVNWCPDTAPTKKKMLNSGTAEYLKKKADGYSVYVQANDLDEWDIDDIAEQVADK